MPQNARINQTDVTADYANVFLWEAGEDGQDYGAVTVGIQEDYYTITSNLQIRNGFVNGFRLEALSGLEAKISDTTFGAGFGGAYNLDLRVANGHVLSLKLDQMNWLRTGDTSFNFKIEKCVTSGAFSSTILQSAKFIDSLCISSGSSRAIDSISNPNSILRSTIINLTGSFSVRSRNATSIVDANDSCFYTAGAGTSLEVLGGGTYTGDYNATHEATNAPGSNAVTNMPRVLSDVFTDPAGNDYTPKIGGVLDGASSTGGFIGATEASSGITITADTGAYSVTGATAILNSQLNLKAITSTYLQSGSNTQLNAQLNITTTSGSYLLTGEYVNLKSAKKLIAESGGYDLTGTGVTLIYTPGGGGEVLIIDTGVYSLAGGELLLKADLRIINEIGSYLLSGMNTTIKYGASIALEVGDYSLYGTGLNLFSNYGMIVTSNSYTLTGKTVVLRYSGDTNQIIGTVTAAFAPDLYSANYKPSTITVTFKG